MQETITIYQPDEETAIAFEAAVDALPDSLSPLDLGSFIWALMRIYDIDPMKRVSICTTLIDIVAHSHTAVDDKSIH